MVDTPQTSPLDARQVRNNAGGYVYKLTDLARLQRFLILGSDKNTFYVGSRELTKQNAECVQRCWDNEPVATAELIKSISISGRAPRNDPALFAIAIGACHPALTTRDEALSILTDVARTLSHLLAFCAYLRTMRRMQGRHLQSALSRWFHSKSTEQLVYQLVKYRERSGWSAGDVLRLAHPFPGNEGHDMAFAWSVGKLTIPDTEPDKDDPLRQIWAFEQAKVLTNTPESKRLLIRLIEDYDLSREMIPTWFLKDADVWEALLQSMPMEAMMRNLVNMTEVGLLTPNSDTAFEVAKRLVNVDRVRKSRLHPLKILNAQKAYSRLGTTVPQIKDALEQAFYIAFGNVRSSGKKFLLGLDVSGSMTVGSIAGTAGITPSEAAAVMAMVTARTEDFYYICGYADTFRELGITASMTLEQVTNLTRAQSFGGTNMSLPFSYALQRQMDVDVFVTYTDNETYMGPHVQLALNRYRTGQGKPDARSIICGMTATEFSIADPQDALQMDVVGFDTATPEMIGTFAAGEI